MIKVTFKPLKRGRYRIIVDGILRGITKNPKKKRLSLMRADQAEITREAKLAYKQKKEDEKYPWRRPSFNFSW